MTSYIDTLRIELEQLTQGDVASAAPESDRGENEPVLAEVPELARRICALAKRYARESALALIDLKFGPVTERKDLEDRAQEAKNKSSFLMEWFWAECRDAAGFWCGEIGMRSGWILVKPAAGPEKLIHEVLRRLLND